jgi:hypothetical protein
MKRNGSRSLIVGLSLLVGLSALVPATLSRTALPTPAQNPWETPQGQACFERWIQEATARLNNADGGQEFNSRKPWQFNQYGLIVGRGMHSNYAPDAWGQYRGNRYWFMWDLIDYTTGFGARWPPWQAAGVPPLRPYVTNCAGGGGGGRIVPPSPPRCDVLGVWRHKTEGVGEAMWVITRRSDGSLQAKERGLGNATGTAVIDGNRLRIGWRISSGVEGVYEWELNRDCLSGSGRVVYSRGASGSRGSTIVRVGSSIEPGINRRGGDYHSFDLPAARPELCQEACARDSRCRAWTYVNPGVQGPAPRCWLKSTVPAATRETCCTSGVK